MMAANTSGWQEWVSVPGRTLELLSGLSHSGINNARTGLLDRNRIEYRPSDNRKKASKYKIIPFIQELPHKKNEWENELRNELENENENESPPPQRTSKRMLYKLKQNKTKQNLKDTIPFAQIITCLNEKAGTSYKPTSKTTQEHIRARWREGYKLPDFFTVIDKKVKEWMGTEQEQYLRPMTLFGTKFEGYLNQKDSRKVVNLDANRYKTDDYTG